MNKRSFLPNDIKDQNRKLVMDLFLQIEKASKVEISEITAISFVTVSKIVNYFVEINLLKELSESEDGSGGLGRKRAVYQLNTNSFFTIGVELVDQQLVGVLINIQGKIVETIVNDEDVNFQDVEFITQIARLIAQLEKKSTDFFGEIIGIGIGINGAIDLQKKEIRMRISEQEENVFSYAGIEQELSSMINYPLLFENDVNASTIAEFEIASSLENSSDVAYITLGDGIGSGLILNKELRRGYHSHAGELEYMYFDKAYTTSPNNLGWLERKIGRSALEKKFELNLRQSQHDKQAQLLCEEYLMNYLSMVIVNIVSLLDIKVVVLSGEVLENLSTTLTDKISEKVNSFFDRDLEVYQSKLENSVSLGAGLLILKYELAHVVSN